MSQWYCPDCFAELAPDATRCARRVVPRLIDVIQQTHDPYLAAEAVTALARIGDPAGLTVVDRIARDGPAVPGAAARAALRRRRDGSRPDQRHMEQR